MWQRPTAAKLKWEMVRTVTVQNVFMTAHPMPTAFRRLTVTTKCRFYGSIKSCNLNHEINAIKTFNMQRAHWIAKSIERVQIGGTADCACIKRNQYTEIDNRRTKVNFAYTIHMQGECGRERGDRLCFIFNFHVNSDPANVKSAEHIRTVLWSWPLPTASPSPIHPIKRNGPLLCQYAEYFSTMCLIRFTTMSDHLRAHSIKVFEIERTSVPVQRYMGRIEKAINQKWQRSQLLNAQASDRVVRIKWKIASFFLFLYCGRCRCCQQRKANTNETESNLREYILALCDARRGD